VGDKVRVKETGTMGYEYETIESYHNSKDIEPYFEEEESKEEMIKIKGKEFSEDTIQKSFRTIY